MGELCTRLQSRYLGPETIAEICSNTVTGSMLRKLVSHEVALAALNAVGCTTQPAYFSGCLDELNGMAVEALESVRELTSKYNRAQPKYSDVFVASSFLVPEK